MSALLTLAALSVPGAQQHAAAEPTPNSCVFSASSFPVALPPRCQRVGEVIGVSLTGNGQMDFGVPMPAAGEVVGISVYSLVGRSYSLDALNPTDGEPSASLVSSDPLAVGTAATSPTKCNDYAYSFLLDHPPGQTQDRKALIETSYDWYSNVASTPASVSQTKALAGLKRAAAAISNTSSTCDDRDLNPKPQYYKGDRALAGDVKQDGCANYGSTDNINNVVFGPITNPSFLALTCRWLKESPSASYWLVKEADVRFRSSGASWKFADESCATGFSLVGVAAHEFGHVWGLDHVDEATHGNLTMSTNVGYCDFDAVNLGYGDLRGLGYLYGTLS